MLNSGTDSDPFLTLRTTSFGQIFNITSFLESIDDRIQCFITNPRQRSVWRFPLGPHWQNSWNNGQLFPKVVDFEVDSTSSWSSIYHLFDILAKHNDPAYSRTHFRKEQSTHIGTRCQDNVSIKNRPMRYFIFLYILNENFLHSL